jgi:peptidoglycan/xylan/chitin deacetylase (PgdA/CDA1 family)
MARHFKPDNESADDASGRHYLDTDELADSTADLIIEPEDGLPVETGALTGIDLAGATDAAGANDAIGAPNATVTTNAVNTPTTDATKASDSDSPNTAEITADLTPVSDPVVELGTIELCAVVEASHDLETDEESAVEAGFSEQIEDEAAGTRLESDESDIATNNGTSASLPRASSVIVASPTRRRRQNTLTRSEFLKFSTAAGLTVAAGAGVFFGVRTYLRSRKPVLHSMMPGFLGARMDALDFPWMVYAHGVTLNIKRVLMGQLGESFQLQVVVGSEHDLLDEAEFMSTDESVATVDRFGKVTARAYGHCEIVVGMNRFTDSCQVQVAEKWVAMTFDDGPMPTTLNLLDGLKNRGVRATFFVLGNMAEGKGETLRRMFSDGHEVGNHTYNHQGGDSVLSWQLGHTDDIIQEATGNRTFLMRPPGGSIYSAMYSCGKPIILWSVDPKDWALLDVDKVYENIMHDTESGYIVLLHDIYQTTVDAALLAIDSLREQGYAFVTVSELLGDPQPGSVYRKTDPTPRTLIYRNPDWPLEG